MFCSTQNEFVDAVTTIAPPLPALAMARPASWMHRKTPVRLTSSTRCQRSSEISRIGWTSAMPAWATRTSRLPNVESECVDGRAHVGAARHVACERLHRPRGRQLGCGRLRQVPVEVEDGDGGALAEEALDDRAPDALGGAGDEHGLAVEPAHR